MLLQRDREDKLLYCESMLLQRGREDKLLYCESIFILFVSRKINARDSCGGEGGKGEGGGRLIDMT